MKIDRFIAGFPAEFDGDLALCRAHGVAYQIDREHLVNYDAAYYDKCAGYDGKDIAQAINAGRAALVDRYVGANRVLDVGIGSGEFIRSRPNTFGHDVNPLAIEWLKRNDLWASSLGEFTGYSFWDVIEHVQDPGEYFRHIQLHSFAFFSLPIFYGLGGVRLSKHYRPGEHLQYFTEDGFTQWMGMHGFMLLERQDFEIRAGRESIYSFAFKRIKWPAK
jgi:hypothetical protein